jgi:hypothetical protein
MSDYPIVAPVVFNPNLGSDTYAVYDSSWTQSNSVSPVSSVNAKPGYTWVSLSWTPPAGGLNVANGECGYVVYRSAIKPPTSFYPINRSKSTSSKGDPTDFPDAQIVYVGTETYFGDMPLSENTSGLLTADMGLAQGTTYYYSVFVVTTIPAGATSGYYSAPLSIAVTTLKVSKPLVNLVQNPAFKDDSIWKLAGFGSANLTYKKGGADMLYTPLNNTYLTVKSLSPTSSQQAMGWIYQTITLPEGLIPGKLYSYTFWYRTDNPLTMEDYSANKQIYTPSVSVYGPIKWKNNAPLPSIGYDIFQATQSIHSETSSKYSGSNPTQMCTFEDDENAVRSALYQTQSSINYDYNNQNITGFWTQGGGSFVIGVPGPTDTRLPYNYSAKGEGGDPVQTPSPAVNGSFGPTSLGDTITLVIGIQPATKNPPSLPGDNAPLLGNIDLTDFQIIEGLPPVTDFFFSLPRSSGIISNTANLIQNASFNGIYSPTLGAVSPPWIFTAASVPDVTGGGTFPTKAPAPSNACSTSCSGMDAAGNPCTCKSVSDCAGAGCLCNICPCADPKNLIPCGSPVYKNSKNGTNTDGLYQAWNNNWNQQGSFETCSGAALCFSLSTDARYNGNDVPPFCTAPINPGDPDSYMVLIGSCCANQSVQLLNIYNYALEAEVTYEFDMEYMLLSVGSFNSNASDNTSQSCLANCMGSHGLSPNLTMSIAINDGVGKGNTLNSQLSQTVTLNDKPDSAFLKLSALNNRVLFTPPNAVNLQIIISLPSCNADGYMVAIRNPSITPVQTPTSKGDFSGLNYGLQDPFPTIPTVPYVRDMPNNSIVWTMPAPNKSETIEYQLLNQTASFGHNKASTASPGNVPTISDVQIGPSQGLVLYNNFHTVPSDCPEFVSIISDTDSTSPLGSGAENVLSLTQTNFINSPKPATMPTNTSAFVISNAYYGSGQWDAWVKLAEVLDLNANPYPKNPTTGRLPNPLGSSLAFWIFHYYDNVIVGGSRLLLDSQSIHNTEIDIEMNGDCPENSQCFSKDIQVGRLNGWGGQWGCGSGCGSNFTMHTLTPKDANGNGIMLNDGKYHKLSFLYHSGIDLTPDLIDPNNANQPQTRVPGFIKWFIDDIEWGSGWVGNQYGFDNVPMTATRIYLGPWDPDWSGGNVGCMPSYYSKCSNGGPPVGGPDSIKGGCCIPITSPLGLPKEEAAAFQCAVMPSFNGCNATKCPVSSGDYTTWSAATWYVAMMQFTPINLDNPDHTTPPYNKAFGTKPEPVGASNRNHWVPETGGWQVFPVAGSKPGFCK